MRDEEQGRYVRMRLCSSLLVSMLNRLRDDPDVRLVRRYRGRISPSLLRTYLHIDSSSRVGLDTNPTKSLWTHGAILLIDLDPVRRCTPSFIFLGDDGLTNPINGRVTLLQSCRIISRFQSLEACAGSKSLK